LLDNEIQIFLKSTLIGQPFFLLMENFKNLQIIRKETIPTALLQHSPAKLENLNNDVGFENKIVTKHIHRPQLALAGYVELFNFNCVQFFGNTEIYYLKSLTKSERIKRIKKLLEFKIPCIVITNNHKIDQEILDLLSKYEVAVFRTKFASTKAITLLSEFLDDQFIEQATVHGSFVDVYGVGILLIGKSGIGKSEITLDLVERGHRLVADDVVMISKKRDTTLMGTGTNLVQHFMEIRGLGIIDVRQMFGIRSIRFQKRLELIVELEVWSNNTEYTRTGLENIPTEIMGVEIPTVKLPIFPGKNVTVITEVIALNYLLKTYGYNAAEKFSEKLTEQIRRKKTPGDFNDDRIVNYMQGDTE